MPIDYTLGKIYKIVDNTNDNIYIGSTCQNTLAQRLSTHVQDYKKFLNDKYNYTTSFDIIKNQNYEILLLEIYPCNSKDQLHAREARYIRSLDCVNKYIPGRTKKEYVEDNKEKIKEDNKNYRENNKEK